MRTQRFQRKIESSLPWGRTRSASSKQRMASSNKTNNVCGGRPARSCALARRSCASPGARHQAQDKRRSPSLRTLRLTSDSFRRPKRLKGLTGAKACRGRGHSGPPQLRAAQPLASGRLPRAALRSQTSRPRSCQNRSRRRWWRDSLAINGSGEGSRSHFVTNGRGQATEMVESAPDSGPLSPVAATGERAAAHP